MELNAERLARLSDDERRLEVLKQIARDGGILNPSWTTADPRGYRFAATGEPPMDKKIDDDIQFLSRGDYISSRFFERLSRCPRCSSHAINLREVCPSCGSANLVGQPLLHHFRCGFVGPIDTFGQDSQNHWQCPKCNRSLKHLGTDYEHTGEHFSCRNCFASFQDADAEGFCVSCGTKTPSDSLDSEDVQSYRLSPLGAAAIRTGRLFNREDEQMLEGTLPIYRRRVIKSLLADELRRKRRYKIDVSFMLVVVGLSVNSDETARREELFLKRMTDFLRDVDTAGRYDECSYVVNLPSTGTDGAKVAVRRLNEHLDGQNEAFHVELIVTDDLEDLDGALVEARQSEGALGVAPLSGIAPK